MKTPDKTPAKTLGLKHRCLHCNALFYDLGKESPVCPACDKPHNIEDAIQLKPFQSEDKPASPKDDDDMTGGTPLDDEDDDAVLGAEEDDDDPVAVTDIKPDEKKEEE